MADFFSGVAVNVAVGLLEEFLTDGDRSGATPPSGNSLSSLVGDVVINFGGRIVSSVLSFFGIDLGSDDDEEFLVQDLQFSVDDEQFRLTDIDFDLSASEILESIQTGGSEGFLSSALRGADTLTGTNSSDVLSAFDGNDTLDAREGDDVLDGGAGGDRLIGGGGDDIMIGRAGDDTIRGGRGEDDLVGGAQNDRLAGGGQSDVLLGGGGDDLLRGGNGADTLNGGGGEDVLIGNGGNDVFEFRLGTGADEIRGFAVANDLIDLSRIRQITDFEDLVDNHMTTGEEGTEISVSSLVVVEIINVEVERLSQDNFIF